MHPGSKSKYPSRPARQRMGRAASHKLRTRLSWLCSRGAHVHKCFRVIPLSNGPDPKSNGIGKGLIRNNCARVRCYGERPTFQGPVSGRRRATHLPASTDEGEQTSTGERIYAIVPANARRYAVAPQGMGATTVNRFDRNGAPFGRRHNQNNLANNTCCWRPTRTTNRWPP